MKNLNHYIPHLKALPKRLFQHIPDGFNGMIWWAFMPQQVPLPQNNLMPVPFMPDEMPYPIPVGMPLVNGW